MKRIACLLLAACMLLCTSCANSGKTPSAPAKEPVDWLSKSLRRTIAIPLSFQSPDGKRLAVEMRNVQIDSGASIVAAAVEELIKGPSESQYRNVLPGISLNAVEISGPVANIELSGEYEQLFPVEMLTARAAIANTITAVSDVEYVNVYSDGREPGYGGKPLGTMERIIGDLDVYVDQTRQEMDLAFAAQQQNLTETRLATLYFADPSDSFLLAEVRQMEFENANYIKALVTELVSGPRTEGSLPVLEGVELKDNPSVSIVASGKSTVTINLSAEPDNPTLAYGSIVHTITGFVPEVQYIVIKINGVTVDEVADAGEFTDGLMRSEHYSLLVGGHATLYFPHQKQNSLVAVQRTMYNRSVDDPKMLLAELIKGPLECEGDQIKGAFPDGVTADDVISVGLSDNTAIVNLSSSFYSMCESLSNDEKYLMIYSIVDTMTEIYGIKRTQFLADGKTIDLLGGLCLSSPLLKNVGIIANP